MDDEYMNEMENIECNSCQREVTARVMGEFEYYDWELDGNILALLLKCLYCQRPIFAHCLPTHDESNPFDEPMVLFPKRHGTKYNKKIPEQIRKSLVETEKCLLSCSPIGAISICRRILEGLVVLHYGDGLNLYEGIQKLWKDKKIDERLFEWAKYLRKSGNLALHNINVDLTNEDARDVYSFTLEILEYVYVLKDRFNSFKKRQIEKGIFLSKTTKNK